MTIEWGKGARYEADGAYREGEAEQVGESEPSSAKEPQERGHSCHALTTELGQVEAVEAHYDACIGTPAHKINCSSQNSS